MNSRLVYVLGCILVAGLAIARADELPEYEETSNDEEQSIEMEDTETALVENDAPLVNKGFCQVGVSNWVKHGKSLRCNCMKCVCKLGGKWACGYEFSYCPYFYCGNQIYNPKSHICCCGKKYAKKNNWQCCGYSYYNTLTSKCCSFFSIKSKKAYCPRSKI